MHGPLPTEALADPGAVAASGCPGVLWAPRLWAPAPPAPAAAAALKAPDLRWVLTTESVTQQKLPGSPEDKNQMIVCWEDTCRAGPARQASSLPGLQLWKPVGLSSGLWLPPSSSCCSGQHCLRTPSSCGVSTGHLGATPLSLHRRAHALICFEFQTKSNAVT